MVLTGAVPEQIPPQEEVQAEHPEGGGVDQDVVRTQRLLNQQFPLPPRGKVENSHNFAYTIPYLHIYKVD